MQNTDNAPFEPHPQPANEHLGQEQPDIENASDDYNFFPDFSF